MTTLTLLTRLQYAHKLSEINDALKLTLQGLKVEAKIIGTAIDRWTQIDLEGEDKEIAMNLIRKEIGFCPINIENLSKFSTLKGYIEASDTNSAELKVDVGVFQPEIFFATLPLSRLQAQLANGKKISLGKLCKLFCLSENLPLQVKITNLQRKTGLITAELSPQQVEQYANWQDALLDKLIVLGVTFRQVKNTVMRLKLKRDVICVDPLSIFSHVLTCKLGTDAVGLIPRIGRILKTAKFAVYSPRRISAFLEKYHKFDYSGQLTGTK